ncbi:MAG: lysozyme [Candidatus Azobacteroides sp.]|nr:lysozyme [Candidatus Azobacteroides sp.]
MTTSKHGIDFIASHEGLSLTAYKCPAGIWTIGYGHTKGVKEGDIVTLKKAREFLKDDLKDAEKAVNANLSGLTQNQFDALVSFVFNVGSGNFSSSTLLKKAKVNPNDPDIANEFAKWNKGGGKVLPGLTRRRKEEAELYFS